MTKRKIFRQEGKDRIFRVLSVFPSCTVVVSLRLSLVQRAEQVVSIGTHDVIRY